jgi:hypothetical protein
MSTIDRKRYYDTWETNNDDDASVKTGPIRNKGLNKYQARLGKLSPFYDCINDHRVNRK